MAGYYVFFRCWPGFTEPFPFDRFNALPDDMVADALDSFAREQLRLSEVHEQIKQFKQEARRQGKNYTERLKAQSMRRTGGPPAGIVSRLTRHEFAQIHWRAVHGSERTDPLVCRLGAYLGWWRRTIIGEDVGFPAVWFWTSDSLEFVTQLVTELNQHPNLDYDAHELEYYANPRFGWIAADGLEPGKCASIQRCINSIQNGREPDLPKRKLVIVIGSRAVKVAKELSAAWPGEENGEAAPTPPAAKTEQGGGSDKWFRVALSFPGEYRAFVENVVNNLADHLSKNRIFYDKWYEHELGRPNLDTYLQKIYHDDSELIVIFLCAEYEKKVWCGLEWRAIRDLIKKKHDSKIMFIRFDNTTIPGVFSIDGYVDVGDRSESEIAFLILKRLETNDQQNHP